MIGFEKPTNENEVVLNLVKYINVFGLKEGDKLPSIRKLAEDWDVSPSVVRSGLLRASTLGLIRMHPRAGSFVQRFDFSHIGNMFSLLFEVAMSQAEPRILHLYQLKTVLEVEMFRIAASIATPEEIFELKKTLEGMEDLETQESFVQRDEDFHLTVAAIARNPIIETVFRAVLAMLRPDRLSNPFKKETRLEIVQDHKNLYQAICDKDPQRASSLAANHSDRRVRELLLSE